MAEKTFKLVFIKSTKNKHVYADNEEVFGSVYIPKSELPEPAPSGIELILRVPE